MLIRELHAVLVHARPDDMLQLFMLDQAIPINVVDLEEEFNLILWRLSSELMNSLDKLLQGNGSRVVLVEDLEDAFAEKGLERDS